MMDAAPPACSGPAGLRVPARRRRWSGCLILLVFEFALRANVVLLFDGYRAAEGISGTPGTAVVTAVDQQRDGQVCLGIFTSEEALLAPAHTSPFVGDEQPRAWAVGATTGVCSYGPSSTSRSCVPSERC